MQCADLEIVLVYKRQALVNLVGMDAVNWSGFRAGRPFAFSVSAELYSLSKCDSRQLCHCCGHSGWSSPELAQNLCFPPPLPLNLRTVVLLCGGLEGDAE